MNQFFPNYTYQVQTEKKKNRMALNQMLDGADILLLKSNDPKLIISNGSKSLKMISRPYTMVGDRVKQFMKQQQRKRINTQNEETKKQFDSIKQKTQRFNTQISRQIKDEKLKLKECIGKLNLLNQNNQNCTSNPTELIFQFFQCLIRTQNYYQGIFKYITNYLKKQIIFNKNNFDEVEGIKFLIETTKNSELIRAMYSQQKIIVTYKQVCKTLSQQMIKIVKSFDIQKQQYQTYCQKLQKLVQEKNQLIKNMKKQKITQQEWNKLNNQNFYPIIQKLEQQITTLTSQLQIAQNLNQQTIANYEQLKKTNLTLAERIDDLRNKIRSLENQRPQSLSQIRYLADVQTFQNHATNLKNMLDKSIIRMIGMKQQFNKLQQHNSNLINQRGQLARRAAFGYDQLTPRPNVKQIFQSEGLINFDKIFKDSNKKKLTTQQLIKILVKKFKSSFQNYKQTEVQVPKKKLNSSLNKLKKPEKLLTQLIKTKQKILETQESAENIRKKFIKYLQYRKQ